MYETMSTTSTQIQVCTATPISSFVQCSDFISIIAFVSRHIYRNLFYFGLNLESVNEESGDDEE